MRRQSLLLLAGCAFFFTGSIAQQRHANVALSCGPLNAQSFNCPKFGFTYKVPFGWVDRTDDMQEQAEPGKAEGTESEKDGITAGADHASANSRRAETLLAVFERPPQAPGETVDSAVVIAVESRENYPQIKTAADYFGPITDVAEQRGLKAIGEPYAFNVGAKQLVRGDFSKERGMLTIRQSSLVMIEKGKIVSFTFVGGSEDEVEQLIENLKFGVGARPAQVPHR